jgi:hypothetical protein
MAQAGIRLSHEREVAEGGGKGKGALAGCESTVIVAQSQ